MSDVVETHTENTSEAVEAAEIEPEFSRAIEQEAEAFVAPPEVNLIAVYNGRNIAIRPLLNAYLVRRIRDDLSGNGKVIAGQSILPERQRLEISGVTGSLDSVKTIVSYPQLKNGAKITLSVSDEAIAFYKTIVETSKAAVDFVTANGVKFDLAGSWQNYDATTGPNKGRLVGISSVTGVGVPFKVRADFDTDKGFHFNAEVGKGGTLKKKACIFRQESDWTKDSINGKYQNAYYTFLGQLQANLQAPKLSKEKVLQLLRTGSTS